MVASSECSAGCGWATEGALKTTTEAQNSPVAGGQPEAQKKSPPAIYRRAFFANQTSKVYFDHCLILIAPIHKYKQTRTTKQHQQSANTKQQLQNQNVALL